MCSNGHGWKPPSKRSASAFTGATPWWKQRDSARGFGGSPGGRSRAEMEPRTERTPPQAAQPADLIGVPLSAIEDFAHNLHAAGVDGSQIAVFAASAALDNDSVVIRFARALARDSRVVLVALGAGDAAVREISANPDAPGLAALAAALLLVGAASAQNGSLPFDTPTTVKSVARSFPGCAGSAAASASAADPGA